MLGRLIAQLRSLGARSTVVLTRPEWEADVQGAVAPLGATVEVRTASSPAAPRCAP